MVAMAIDCSRVWRAHEALVSNPACWRERGLHLQELAHIMKTFDVEAPEALFDSQMPLQTSQKIVRTKNCDSWAFTADTSLVAWR